MIVREATPSDNDALLALTRLTPMPGLISLRIDRDPDFFALLRLRGQGKTFVAESEGSVVGTISVSYRSGFVRGVPEPIGYIGDLKVHPAHRGGRVAYRLMRTVYEHAQEGATDLFVCLVAGGNDGAVSLLRGAAGLPRFEALGRFLVHALLPSPFSRGVRPYEVGEAMPDDVPHLLRFVNRFNASYELAALLSPEDLLPAGGSPDGLLRPLLARTERRVEAMLVPFDASREKANVVVGMPPALRAATAVLQQMGRFVPLMVPPRMGEPLRMLYVRHVACEPGCTAALRVLLHHIRAVARRREYSLVLLGLHERDPLVAVVARMPRFTFVSRGFVLSLGRRREVVAAIRRGIPAEDFALV